MTIRSWLPLSLAGAFLLVHLVTDPLQACCPAPGIGKFVVNADQTVIIIWDAATKTQHFIRQASFRSEADDFGFLVPTPSQPELDESGNEAFPFFRTLTEPERRKALWSGGGIGCGLSAGPGHNLVGSPPPAVHVLEEKSVAGFQAAVLEANSTTALVNWLKVHGYAFSPEVEAWAKPYVEGGWKITALKVAKSPDGKLNPKVTASALRLSFKTDRPLFPYREPNTQAAAEALRVHDRLLRIYFIAEARYQGELTREVPWTGEVVWANKLTPADRKKALELLKLPDRTGPATWWLTEFEDHWPYQSAPADLYFSRSRDQKTVKRPPVYDYASTAWPTDIMAYALAVVVVGPPLLRRVRRGRKERGR
jgi:hypothetical protein